MKQLFFLKLLLLTFSSFGQTKEQDIQELISVLQIKSTMQTMVSESIELYKKQKPFVINQVWENIKNSVDYTVYLNSVSSVFSNNYTQAQIKQLISLTIKAKPGKQPKFKPAVKEQLYNASNKFGKKFALALKEKVANSNR